MRTFKAVIQRWESGSALARELGENAITVRQWRNRNRIPADRWLAIVAAAGRAGFVDVTLDLLAAIARDGGELRTGEPVVAPPVAFEHPHASTGEHR